MARIRVGRSVGVAAARKLTVSGKLDRRTKYSRDLYAKAELVRKQSEDLAKDYFGESNRIVSSFVVVPGRDGFPLVTNNAKSDKGKDIYDVWERGSGIYGPKKRPITPKSTQYMVFKTKGNLKYARQRKRADGSSYGPLEVPEYIRTKSVKGVKGQKFLTRGALITARRKGWRYTPRTRI
jgi:hypothetical protein